VLNIDKKTDITPLKLTFKPTAKMFKWFNALDKLGYEATLKDVSLEAKVSIAQYYTWLQKDEFVNWIDEQFQRSIKTFRWKLDRIGLKKAENNYQYWHDMMIRTGNILPEGVNNTLNAQFNIGDAELKRIITG
jgi:hypothetical protein